MSRNVRSRTADDVPHSELAEERRVSLGVYEWGLVARYAGLRAHQALRVINRDYRSARVLDVSVRRDVAHWRPLLPEPIFFDSEARGLARALMEYKWTNDESWPKLIVEVDVAWRRDLDTIAEARFEGAGRVRFGAAEEAFVRLPFDGKKYDIDIAPWVERTDAIVQLPRVICDLALVVRKRAVEKRAQESAENKQ